MSNTNNEIQKTHDSSITYRPRTVDDDFTSTSNTEYMFTSPFANNKSMEEDDYTQLLHEEDDNFHYNSYNTSRKKLSGWYWAWSIMVFVVFFPSSLSFLLDPPSGTIDSTSLTFAIIILIGSMIPLAIMFIIRYMRS